MVHVVTLNLTQPHAEIFVPDDVSIDAALARTTHLGIGAHHDDLEILAIDGILRAYENPASYFTGIVMTDGAGSPRTGEFAAYTDAQMAAVRIEEQKQAARIGRYSAVALLGHTSAALKDTEEKKPIDDLKQLIAAASPDIIYTHNPFDKHPTHVAVCVRVVEALRALLGEQGLTRTNQIGQQNPQAHHQPIADHSRQNPDLSLPPDRLPRLYGVEVWRDLDWLPDDRKIVFDCSANETLQAALLATFESQIAGGQAFDRAVMGRRAAHATFLDPHAIDAATAAVYAVDMTPLLTDPTLPLRDFCAEHIAAFQANVLNQL